jgi:hypothetical protein
MLRIRAGSYVFRTSGSVSTKSGSGTVSGSYFHQAKMVRKPLIPTVLWLLYDVLFSKNYVNAASKSTVISKKT